MKAYPATACEDRVGQVWEVWDNVHFRDRPESAWHWVTLLVLTPPRPNPSGALVRVLVLCVTNPESSFVEGESHEWYAEWFEGHSQARRVC